VEISANGASQLYGLGVFGCSYTLLTSLGIPACAIYYFSENSEVLYVQYKSVHETNARRKIS